MSGADLRDQAVSICVDLEPTDQGAVHLLFLIDAYATGLKAICCAKSKTLAEKLGCSDRSVRRRWARLVELGLVCKVRRRCRSSWRDLTELGREVLDVMRAGGPLAVVREASGSSAHASAHKGEQESADHKPRARRQKREAAVPGACDPAAYTLPRAAARLTTATWGAVAGWLGSARSVTFARCRMAHRVFAGMVHAVWRCREYDGWMRAMAGRGLTLSADDLVRLAIEDAARRGRDFGTVETANALIGRIVLDCITERRLPGERRIQRRR